MVEKQQPFETLMHKVFKRTFIQWVSATKTPSKETCILFSPLKKTQSQKSDQTRSAFLTQDNSSHQIT